MGVLGGGGAFRRFAGILASRSRGERVWTGGHGGGSTLLSFVLFPFVLFSFLCPSVSLSLCLSFFSSFFVFRLFSFPSFTPPSRALVHSTAAVSGPGTRPGCWPPSDRVLHRPHRARVTEQLIAGGHRWSGRRAGCLACCGWIWPTSKEAVGNGLSQMRWLFTLFSPTSSFCFVFRFLFLTFSCLLLVFFPSVSLPSPCFAQPSTSPQIKLPLSADGIVPAALSIWLGLD